MFNAPEKKEHKKSYSPRVRTGYYHFKGGFNTNRWQHVHVNLLLPTMTKEEKIEIAAQIFNYDNRGAGPESYTSIRMNKEEAFSLLISMMLVLREYGRYLYKGDPKAMHNELQKRLDGVYSGYFDDRIQLFGKRHSDGTWQYRDTGGEDDGY